jgi:hypothetical protein
MLRLGNRLDRPHDLLQKETKATKVVFIFVCFVSFCAITVPNRQELSETIMEINDLREFDR